MDSAFMNLVATGVAAAGIQVVRFEFPYMAERRSTGKKRPPNPPKQLLSTWREIVDQLGDRRRLVVGAIHLSFRVFCQACA